VSLPNEQKLTCVRQGAGEKSKKARKKKTGDIDPKLVKEKRATSETTSDFTIGGYSSHRKVTKTSTAIGKVKKNTQAPLADSWGLRKQGEKEERTPLVNITEGRD